MVRVARRRAARGLKLSIFHAGFRLNVVVRVGKLGEDGSYERANLLWGPSRDSTLHVNYGQRSRSESCAVLRDMGSDNRAIRCCPKLTKCLRLLVNLPRRTRNLLNAIQEFGDESSF